MKAGAPTFRTLAHLEAIEPPTDKPAIYARHETEPWFGCCILRPKKNSGKSTRRYFVRLGDKRQRIADTSAMSYSDARKEAKRLHVEYEARATPSTYTLKQAWEKMRDQRLRQGAWSEATLENYMRFVPPEDEPKAPITSLYVASLWNLRLAQITPGHVERVFDSVYDAVRKRNEKRKSPRLDTTGRATVAALGRWLHALLQYAKNENWISYNPMSSLLHKGYLKAGEPRDLALRADDTPAFFSWLNTRAHPGARDFILIGLFLGLRAAVIGSLEWKNVDIARGVLFVPPNVRGNKRRTLVVYPVPDYVMQEVPRRPPKFPHLWPPEIPPPLT